MNLYKISLQSLRRRKSKTLFMILGLILAVTSVVILFTVSENINLTVAKNLDEFGANILVLPKNDRVSLSYGGFSFGGVSYNHSELSENDIALINTIKNNKNISIIAPKLINIISLNDQEVLTAGVQFQEELRLKKWWNIIGDRPTDHSEILIGSDIKKKLNLGLNQFITIEKQQFKIVGIIKETGSQDDGMIFLDIKEAQRIFNKKGIISLAEVSALCYDCPIGEIVKQTSEKIPGAQVTAIKQTIDAKMIAVKQFEIFSIGISILMLVVSGLIVFITVNSSVNERTRELGIFKAIGFRRAHIIQIVITEVLAASVFSGLVGYFIGMVASKFLIPILLSSDGSNISIDYLVFLLAITLAIIIGLIASVYPALKATKLDPVVAFRSL